jgi:hypothetical protein
MKRMTWLTEERIVAPATGALAKRDASWPAAPGSMQVDGKAGFVPAAFGPGLVCGNTASTIRTAPHGMPLRSPGAGFG